MKTLISTLSVLALGLSTHFAAADDIRLGEPGFGGNGCPQGTASSTLSPDQKSLSILFDEYLVEAEPKKLERKNCNIAIPVHVPQGLSLSIIEVDYRGYAYLPKKAKATFSAEYFFAGIRGPKFKQKWKGPLDEDYKFDNDLSISARVWSECGADVNLRVNSSMRVNNRNRSEEALATVDSADFKAGIVYHLAWKKCDMPKDANKDI